MSDRPDSVGLLLTLARYVRNGAVVLGTLAGIACVAASVAAVILSGTERISLAAMALIAGANAALYLALAGQITAQCKKLRQQEVTFQWRRDLPGLLVVATIAGMILLSAYSSGPWPGPTVKYDEPDPPKKIQIPPD